MVLEEDNPKRSVTFTKEAADQTLIATVEQELAKQKYKNFSDLCKQALRQFFLLSKHVQPVSLSGQVEEQLAQLYLKFAELEQKVLAKDTTQFERIEHQLHQLTQPSKAGQIEEQMKELHLQYAEFEQKILVQTTNWLEGIEGRLFQLLQSPSTEQISQSQQTTPPLTLEQMEKQLAVLEQKLLVKNTSHLERIENQLHQLAQQIQHLPTQQPQQLETRVHKTITPPSAEVSTPPPSREIDPVLSRLSPLFEDF